MKRQRNIQQVKEHDNCLPNLTKEEEIGNLPEKEFKIIIVKMTQNFESKMKLQIRKTEAEDKISEVEHRMVEINEAGRKKRKKNF